MSIYRTNRRSKPWGYRWREGGKHHSRSFKEKAEAIAFQGKIVGEKFSGTLKPANRGNQKFEPFARSWMESMDEWRASTASRNLEIFELHVFPVIGSMKLNEITRATIKSLIHSWKKKGLKPRTIIRQVAVLKGALDEAFDSELIDKNPAYRLKLKKPESPHRRPLNTSEIETLFSTIDSRWHPHLYITIATGMRWSELADLEIQNIDWIKHELHVVKSKTDAGIRTFKLSRRSMKYILQHLSDTCRDTSCKNAPLFVSAAGGKLNYSNFRNRVFKPACLEAGFPELQFHDLRRTTATVLAESGVSAKELQTLLGHTDIRTTLNLYAQSTEDGKKRIAEEMEQILSFLDEPDDGLSEST